MAVRDTVPPVGTVIGSKGLAEPTDTLSRVVQSLTPTAFTDQAIHTTWRLSTGDEQDCWVNRAVFVGEGRLLPGGGDDLACSTTSIASPERQCDRCRVAGRPSRCGCKAGSTSRETQGDRTGIAPVVDDHVDVAHRLVDMPGPYPSSRCHEVVARAEGDRLTALYLQRYSTRHQRADLGMVVSARGEANGVDLPAPFQCCVEQHGRTGIGDLGAQRDRSRPARSIAARQRRDIRLTRTPRLCRSNGIVEA